MGLWKLLYPKEARNIVLNSSAEIAGNFAALGAATITRDTTYAYRGLYSYKFVTVAAEDGGDFVTKAATNAIHFVSFRLVGGTAPDVFHVSMDAGAHLNHAAVLFTDGTVTHYGVQIPAAEANGSTSLHITQEDAAAHTFYIDAVQCEADTTWTTYFDGDEEDCTWDGTKHGSASFRSENVRSGGYVKDLLTDYSLTSVQVVNGYQSPTKETMLEPLAFVDGSVFQGTRASGRRMTLQVTIKGSTLANYHSIRKAFMAAISRHLVVPQQPVTWWYSGAGKIVSVRAFVGSGDEGGPMKGTFERIDLELMAVEDPYWEELAEGTSLIQQSATLTVSYMVAYLPPPLHPWSATTGAWNALGRAAGTGGAAPKVRCFAKDAAGNLFAAGAFTTLFGIANADYIARRDVNGVWAALAAGINSDVHAIVPAPDGLTIFIIGEFTNVGDANGDYVIKWTLAGGFASLAAGCTLPAFAGIMGPMSSNKLYVGTSSVGDGAILKSWDMAAWANFASGVAEGAVCYILSMALAADQKMYVGGAFLTLGGIANTHNIAYYDFAEATPAWHAMATGSADTVASVAIGNDGRIYIGAGAYLKVWEGVSFRTLVTVAGGSATVMDIKVVGSSIYFSGSFTSANGISIVDNFGLWNGTAVVPPTINLPGVAYVEGMFADGEDIYLGIDATGDAVVYGVSPSASGKVNYTGTAACSPVIKVTCSVAAVTLREVRNASTGQALRFNRIMQPGETITINTRSGKHSVRSDFSPPNGSNVVLLMPSELGTFCLKPGANSVSIFAPETVLGSGGVATIALYWRIKHEGAEGGAT